MNFSVRYLSLVLCILLAGCAGGTRVRKDAKPALQGKGIYHKVRPGETLWRIAKSYNVKLDDIIRSNNIPNVAQIEKNQLIFIPGADHVQVLSVEGGVKDSGEFIWPLKGKVVSYFGDFKNSQPTRGIDIQAKEGDTVCAARGGKVIFADFLNGYAFTVVLDHFDGLYSVYSQNAQLLVKVGESVVRGHPVAMSGGNNGTLHFQIRKKSVADNPLYYLPR